MMAAQLFRGTAHAVVEDVAGAGGKKTRRAVVNPAALPGT